MCIVTGIVSEGGFVGGARIIAGGDGEGEEGRGLGDEVGHPVSILDSPMVGIFDGA
jgi:hypothetical protein